MSLYAKYLKEREGITLFETERGFFGYLIECEKLLVTDLYIDEQFRGKESSKFFVDKIEEIARDNDITEIYCSVSNEALNYDKAKAFVEKNKYKYLDTVGELDYYCKRLED